MCVCSVLCAAKGRSSYEMMFSRLTVMNYRQRRETRPLHRVERTAHNSTPKGRRYRRSDPAGGNSAVRAPVHDRNAETTACSGKNEVYLRREVSWEL